MRRARGHAGPVGFVLAACAACCAGPVLAALGLGLAAALGFIFGVVASAVAILSLVSVLVARRRSGRDASDIEARPRAPQLGA